MTDPDWKKRSERLKAEWRDARDKLKASIEDSRRARLKREAERAAK